jgi:hypothetical protein
MARTWLSIRVDLIEGHGEALWPRPGRIFAAARSHTFAQLAHAIDDAFARWDRAHLHDFELPDGTRLSTPYSDWEELGPALDDRRTRLSRLNPGEQFVYVFDFGDAWTHLCTVGSERVDPEETIGIVPGEPLPYWGWGDIPDQYRRRWDGDDGETPPPPDPTLSDLPPLRPGWGSPDLSGAAERHTGTSPLGRDAHDVRIVCVRRVRGEAVGFLSSRLSSWPVSSASALSSLSNRIEQPSVQPQPR